VETRQKAPRQKAKQRKDFGQKGGYQGGFGITIERYWMLNVHTQYLVINDPILL
jgi:hypothetical protein